MAPPGADTESVAAAPGVTSRLNGDGRVRVPLATWSGYVPVVVIDSPENVATPLTALTVAAPRTETPAADTVTGPL